jgi:TonB family protein
MRRALLVSLGLHALGLVLIGAVVRPRFTVPPRLQGIPVDFIALAAPAPALTQRARPTLAPTPALAERTRTVPTKPEESVPDPLRPRREPPRRNPPREEPKREEPKREEPKHEEPKRKPEPKPQPDLPRLGSADTTQVMRSELPRVGDLRGAMQMRVEGEVLPYAYYLSIVQRKIASFWEPPAGIDQQPGEVAAIVWFRIEKDGAVLVNHVEEPSGINPFDTSALRALTRALPLPQLPEDYPGDHLVIHLRFVYSHEASVPAEAR